MFPLSISDRLLTPIPPHGLLSAVAATLGILSHLTLFIRKEWHMVAPFLVWIYFCLALALFCIIHSFLPIPDIRTTLKYTSALIISYCSGLFASIVIYRQHFHRLRCFPGPWAAATTKLWHVWKCRGGKNFLVMEELRQRYGPVVRTGPEEITIIDPSSPLTLDGPRNNCEKAVWYDFLLPEIAVNTTRNKKHHDIRRRIWDRAFSSKAFDTYEKLAVEHAETLISQISQLSEEGNAVVVTDWFYWYTFDVIGELAFAKSFNMLRDKKWHSAVKLLRRAMSLLGPFSPVPWLAQIAFHFIPWMHVIRDWFTMMRWCKQRMDERIIAQVNLEKFNKPDVSYWLIDASLKQGSLEADRSWLNGDAIAIIIAGSDTVGSALVFAAYELACNQKQQDELFNELRNVDIYNQTQLQSCKYLNAVINETLRLHPPVPTGGYRQSPPAGLEINGIHIPGHVTIVSPRYSLGRLEFCYEQADRWIPERWTTKPEMIKDIRGFSPFSQGRYNCVGKNLAMIEMRVVIAMLVRKFRIGFSGADKGETLFSDLRDNFTAAPGKLQLQFHIRT